MLKSPPNKDEVPVAAERSAPITSSSSAVMAALLAQTEPHALCALVASQIVSGSSSTCGSRAAIAAAFDDVHEDAVGELLRGRTC